jgi:hypothetical protein
MCWEVHSLADAYTAPEMASPFLTGVRSTGTRVQHICTSAIKTITPKGVAITYGGSRYELGHPSEKYESKFPNARARLIKAYEKDHI